MSRGRKTAVTCANKKGRNVQLNNVGITITETHTGGSALAESVASARVANFPPVVHVGELAALVTDVVVEEADADVQGGSGQNNDQEDDKAANGGSVEVAGDSASVLGGHVNLVVTIVSLVLLGATHLVSIDALIALEDDVEGAGKVATANGIKGALGIRSDVAHTRDRHFNAARGRVRRVNDLPVRLPSGG